MSPLKHSQRAFPSIMSLAIPATLTAMGAEGTRVIIPAVQGEEAGPRIRLEPCSKPETELG